MAKNFLKIDVKYKGKKYDTVKAAFMKAAVDKMQQRILEMLQPYEGEINAAGGSVIMDVDEETLKTKVRIENIPDELQERIKRDLGI